MRRKPTVRPPAPADSTAGRHDRGQAAATTATAATAAPTAAARPVDLHLVLVAAAAWGGVLLGGVGAGRWPTAAEGDVLAGARPDPAVVGAAVIAGLALALAAAARLPRRRPPPADRNRPPARPDGRPEAHPDGRPGARVVRSRDVTCWVLVLLAAAGCGLVRGVAVRSGPVAVLASTGETVHAVGTVRGVPGPVRSTGGAPGAVLVVLTLRRLEDLRPRPDAPVTDVTVHADVSVLAPAAWAGLPVGEQVRARLRLQPAPPGRRVQAWAQALGPPVRLAGPDRLHRAVDRVRDGLVASCRRLPQPARGLVPAVVDGDTRGVSAATTSDLRVSSLLHLSAVSGANVAILLASVTGLLGLLGVGRITTAAVSLAVVAGFALVADQAPSVLRAGLTAALGLSGARAGGPGTGLRLLATASAVLVLVTPDLSRDAGFALSVGATAAILATSGGLAGALRRWLPRPLAGALAVSLAAQLGAQPVLGALSGQLSLVGPVANLLAAPAVVPVTVLGLLAAVLAPLSGRLSADVALGAAPAAWWLAAVAHACAHLPGAAVGWPAGWVGAGCALVLAGAGLRWGPVLLAHRAMALPAAGVLVGVVVGPLVLPR